MTFPCRCTGLAIWLATALTAAAQGFQPGDYGTVTLHLKADSLALANNAPVPVWGPLTAAGTSQPIFLASDPLFGSEQFSIGGAYSVRGFRESTIANDNGFILTPWCARR